MGTLRVGTKVVVTDKQHPHHGEAGRITEPATGSPADVGLDWLVELDGAWSGSCYVSEHEVRAI